MTRTIRGVFISQPDADGVRLVAMRSPRGADRLLWFRVLPDTRTRERLIRPEVVPQGIKERAYNALNGV